MQLLQNTGETIDKCALPTHRENRRKVLKLHCAKGVIMMEGGLEPIT